MEYAPEATEKIAGASHNWEGAPLFRHVPLLQRSVQKGAQLVQHCGGVGEPLGLLHPQCGPDDVRQLYEDGPWPDNMSLDPVDIA